MDTGASVCAIPKSLARILERDSPECITRRETENVVVKVADGKVVPTSGFVTIRFKLAGEEYAQEFLVLEQMNTAILGWPFFAEHEFTIDCRTRRVKTESLSLQMNNLEVDEQKRKKKRSGERGIPLLTTKAITLPPGRLDYVQCHVDSVDTNLEGLTGVVESNTTFVRRSGICVGDSLSTVDGNKQVRVGLLNMGETPYTVLKGSRVATIEVMTAKQAEYLKPIMPEIAEKLH